MKPVTCLIIAACAGLFAGCAASIPPVELIDARQAYAHAIAGSTAQIMPEELLRAREALDIAERSFQNNPGSFRTRDLAYVANRKAKTAEALARTAAERIAIARANKDYRITQTEILKVRNENVAAAGATAVFVVEQHAAEPEVRTDARSKALAAQANLVKLAVVREEARGLVITLSSNVVFTPKTSALSSAALNRLNQVADALMVTKERKLTVEGHTDSWGSANRNQELSRQRAEAVRLYIISRGYPGDLIEAQGVGGDRPVADNASPEGRANNCRVEIIIDRSGKQ